MSTGAFNGQTVACALLLHEIGDRIEGLRAERSYVALCDFTAVGNDRKDRDAQRPLPGGRAQLGEPRPAADDDEDRQQDEDA
jgi:hypothetical protein